MSRHIEKFIEQFTEEFELPLTVKKVTNGKITIYKLTHKNAKYSMILEKIPNGLFFYHGCKNIPKKGLGFSFKIEDIDAGIKSIIHHYNRQLKTTVWNNLEKEGKRLNNTPDPS